MNTAAPSSPAKGWITCRVGDFTLETDFEVDPGQVLVLFGPSGAGKTTTLRSIAGLLRPQQGQIQLSGRLVYDSASGVWVPPHLRRVGYLTQEHNLFPHLRVSDNIAYGLSSRRSAAAGSRVQELLETFRLGGLAQRYPWELSGGQQQRVALARALAPAPQALLLDEPFASLDAELRRALQGELRAILSRSNLPVILVTHDREEALALGDAVQVIAEGRTLSKGERASKRRPQFQQMLKDAQAGLFDVIVCWKSDRLSRGLYPAVALSEALEGTDIGLESVKDTIDRNSFDLMAVGKIELQNIRERARMGARGRASKGLVSGVLKYGYIIGPDSKPEIQQEEAEVVKQIFAWRASESPPRCVFCAINPKSLRSRSDAESGSSARSNAWTASKQRLPTPCSSPPNRTRRTPSRSRATSRRRARQRSSPPGRGSSGGGSTST